MSEYITADQVRLGDTIQVVSEPVKVHYVYPPGEYNDNDEIELLTKALDRISIRDGQRILLIHRK